MAAASPAARRGELRAARGERLAGSTWSERTSRRLKTLGGGHDLRVSSARGRIEREIRDVQARMRRYYDQFETGKLNPQRFEVRLNELESQEVALRERQAQLVSQTGFADRPFPADVIKQTRKLLKTVSRIGGADDIKCTYRLPTDDGLEAVRATTSEVGLTGLEPVTLGLSVLDSELKRIEQRREPLLIVPFYL